MSDELEEGGIYDLRDPLGVARLFAHLLASWDGATALLEYVIAPETRSGWGDLTDVAAHWRSAGFAGIHTTVTYAHGDRTVAYVPMLDADDIGQEREDGPAIVLGVINLVWREDLDRWMVFALAEMLPPERAPRGPN
jgi:hypothetical protein